MLGNIKVTKGTLVMTSSMTNHYNPDNFENPTEFKPERWMGE
jgi:cytochrome P450